MLDTVGLDGLAAHMTHVPEVVLSSSLYIYCMEALQTALMFDSNATSDHQYRALVLADCTNMHGLVAQSLEI